MHHRIIRSSIVALLIAVGIGAGYILWDSHQQSIAAADRSRALNAALDTLVADLAELGAAQQAYVAPGQSEGPWMTRVSSLLQRVYDEAAALRSAGPAGESAAKAMRDSLDALVDLDSHAREYLRMQQDLMASDIVFNDARQSLAAIAASASTVRGADAAAKKEALRRQGVLQAAVLGTTAAVWVVGLLLLVRTPKTESAAPSIEPSAPAEVPAGQSQTTAVARAGSRSIGPAPQAYAPTWPASRMARRFQ
jgi:hypothetical protein